MQKVDGFSQPMEFTGIPETSSWAGYDFLQWTGSVFHPGLDYNFGAGEADNGKPIFNIANGIVEKCIYWDGKTTGFGNHLFVRHIANFDIECDGTVIKAGQKFYSHYCHLKSINVKEGDEIEKGKMIGTCGGSGGWASHLHLELRLPIGLGYESWVKDWSAEKVLQYYLDPFQVVEKYKTIPYSPSASPSSTPSNSISPSPSSTPSRSASPSASNSHSPSASESPSPSLEIDIENCNQVLKDINLIVNQRWTWFGVDSWIKKLRSIREILKYA